MLDLNDFFYFVQVVECRGFTAAGRALGMPKSTLSYRMKKLEAELGVRLLNRTSRHFAPTQAGEEFYRHATSVVRAENRPNLSCGSECRNRSELYDLRLQSVRLNSHFGK